jgi:hypothetical protein
MPRRSWASPAGQAVVLSVDRVVVGKIDLRHGRPDLDRPPRAGRIRAPAGTPTARWGRRQVGR